jgi:hypothetical protein
VNETLQVLGALGGIAVFIASVYALLKAGVRQKDSVDANTIAVERLTKAVDALQVKLTGLETRVAVLEAGQKWRR